MENIKTGALKAIPIATTKSSEVLELIAYSALALLIPFSLGHPQLLVGILVNTCLVLAALNLKSYKILPVALLPSMGVLARGLVFGPFTMFLVFMIPFIWAGNLILVFAMKKINNKWLALGLGAVLKTAFLFSIATLLINAGVLPKIFAVSMGMVQLYTAIAGGIIALSFQTIRTRVLKKA
jgi:hypothetical protein